MQFTTSFMAVLVPAALLAGVVRGFAGFGGPLTMLPALTAFMPASAAILVMSWIDLLVNVQLLPRAARQAKAGVVVPLTAGAVLTMPLGVLLLLVVDAAIMKQALSATILVAALVLLSGWRYPGTIGRSGWVGVGALTGVVMGATSLAITSALFLHAGGQSAVESRANFIVWVFVGTIMLLVMLTVGSGFDAELLPAIGLLAPPYIIGCLAGSHLTGRLPDAHVRTAVLLLIVVIAITSLVL
jgi:uncharacterized membrane protein YfcA